MKILVTGGCGFIGSNFIHLLLEKHQDCQVVNFDALTYAGNLENLKKVEDNPRYQFLKGDISNKKDVKKAFETGIDHIVNFAAESHVDRSILDASAFINTNIVGTQILLDHAREHGVKRFLQVSTDEVYGSLGPTGLFREDTPLDPSSPYSASKTSADLLVGAAYRTFELPVLITRCSNNYGPYQFPEKLIPLFISNAYEDKELPIYGDGKNVRDWIHVHDHCRALLKVLFEGVPGEVYNIGSNNERTNLEITELILEILDKPKSLMKYVKDRPGHDRRYAIDSTKIETQLGWKPEVDFKDGMQETIDWYLGNKEWWQHIKSGEYMLYYEKQYGKK